MKNMKRKPNKKLLKEVTLTNKDPNIKYSKGAIVVLTIVILIELIIALAFAFSDKNAVISKLFDIPLAIRIIIIVALLLLNIILIIFVLNFDRAVKEKVKSKLKTNEKKKETKPVYLTRSQNKETNGNRFYQLCEIDRSMANYKDYFDDDLDLKELCEDFRNYSAYKLNLYYDIEDIRKFIASLGISKLIILQGMSGTGKTSLAYAFGEYLKNAATIVPIQPMWKERTDLIGYYNEFTKRFNETTILQKLYLANYKKDIFITVLDEMNIARVEYYFAEFLSLLELPNPESRYLDVVSDKWPTDPNLLKNGQIKLPENMWFIGTCNNDDSTFAVSDKVYDRAMVLNLDKKSQPFKGEETSGRKISFAHFDSLVKNAIKEYKMTARNKKRIKQLDKYLIKTFHITFGNRIMKQLNQFIPIYIACGGDEVYAIDDFISKKVLRKLESLNQVYVRNQTDDFITFLDDLFGKDKMENCIEYMNTLKMRA